MTDSEGVRVTSQEIYNQLTAFRKEFSDYLKDQGPKMAILEYKVKELEDKQHATEQANAAEKASRETLGHAERQNRRMVVWTFLGSSLAVEVINWILFHK